MLAVAFEFVMVAVAAGRKINVFILQIKSNCCRLFLPVVELAAFACQVYY